MVPFFIFHSEMVIILPLYNVQGLAPPMDLRVRLLLGLCLILPLALTFQGNPRTLTQDYFDLDSRTAEPSEFDLGSEGTSL